MSRGDGIFSLVATSASDLAGGGLDDLTDGFARSGRARIRHRLASCTQLQGALVAVIRSLNSLRSSQKLYAPDLHRIAHICVGTKADMTLQLTYSWPCPLQLLLDAGQQLAFGLTWRHALC